MRLMGEMLCSQVVDIQEIQSAKEQAKGEFDSCVYEGLSSDSELGPQLEVTKFIKFEVQDGFVMSRDGKTRVTDLIKNGHATSSEKAQIDSRYENQATRDWNDLINAREVDKMARGETDYNTRMVVSLLPKEAIERDGKDFWQDIGYIPDKETAYIQIYHASDDGEVLTGSLSVDGSDIEKWTELFAENGVTIPEGETTDNWLKYAITGSMTSSEAKSFAMNMRKKYKDSQDLEADNTADLLADNSEVANMVFEEAYVPISKSLENKEQTEKTKSLISSYLNNSDYIKPEVRQHLIRLANTDKFTDRDARLMHQMVVYSTIEMLRSLVAKPENNDLIDYQIQAVIDQDELMHMQQEMINSVVAGFAARGLKAGRSYSSCGGAIKLAEQIQEMIEGTDSIQEAYGGRPRRCKILKDGDRTNCPHCGKRDVKVAIENKELKCDNGKCREASTKAKSTVAKLALVGNK